jgi:hypothetical protein
MKGNIKKLAVFKKPICTLSILGILTFILFIVSAQAEQPVDCLVFYDMKTTTIVETQDLIIMGSEARGIVLDNTGSKFFDNSTVHSVGLMKVDKGKVTGSNQGKHMDPSGDFYVIETLLVGTELDWKFVYGTGKFKGITGAGKAVRFTKGKPISPGTSQYCVKVTGTYELVK